MLEERQSLHDYFRGVLLTVVGQAFQAAGYHLEANPHRWNAGQFVFVQSADGQVCRIAFQLLAYTDNAYAARQPSRFRVTLSRDEGRLPAAHRTLAQLVVADFGVPILPSAEHWWTFTDTTSLGRALGEAGHLIVGYGLPWLAGDLLPDDENGG